MLDFLTPDVLKLAGGVIIALGGAWCRSVLRALRKIQYHTTELAVFNQRMKAVEQRLEKVEIKQDAYFAVGKP